MSAGSVVVEAIAGKGLLVAVGTVMVAKMRGEKLG
jgi:hypothetical protein